MNHQDWDTIIIRSPHSKPEKEKKPHVEVTQQMKLDANDPSKPKMVSKDLAKQIIQARTSKKMTQKQLALAVNEEVSVINKYENAKAVVSNSVLQKLRKALGCKLTITK